MVSRRSLVLGLVLTSILATGPARSADLPSVAVYPTEAGPSAQNLVGARVDAQDISRRLEVALRASRRFQMFERNTALLDTTVLREQRLAQSGLAAANAAEFGRLNNVQLVLVPYVTEFGLGSTFTPLDDFPGRYTRADRGVLRLTVKVLDTTTGEIKYQIETSGSVAQRGAPQSGRGGGLPADSWQRMIDEAAEGAAEKVINSIFPVLVIRTDGRQIFLNRGEGGGVRVGETRALFKAGEALVDPSTGESLGAAETPLGRIKIVRVTARFSVAEPVGTLSAVPGAGDVVR